ncbi:hypothetical protein [Cohnella thailandensis]|uniref:Uncharacterized protein n=1 Tax=Cohnella thailandensis TaxID=557557 RepID=A0A841SL66_9BACL|nr:hypothetical protein [Cohnella thailandensis]MBB6633243.1 hypothetical protein [Cohnella thailandensis]MBP1975059.1 hypothetical protein [Cohnella thailandensis]
MDEIRLIILKIFGAALNSDEIDDVYNWYQENKSRLTNANKLRAELGQFVYSKNKGKKLMFFEEDTSNLDYLLLILDQGKKK